jgi:flavin reductase (DIM6/NTAB) family NADH-FMN oxidoreductase RutF
VQSINAADVAVASQVWLQTPDVLVVTPFGRYNGWDGVKEIYGQPLTARAGRATGIRERRMAGASLNFTTQFHRQAHSLEAVTRSLEWADKLAILEKGLSMKRAYRKRSYPLDGIRRFLEPGPIVLVSSASQGSSNIMTMGWHMMLGFSPALFGCYIWEENHSYQMLRRSKECVINLPTLDLVDTVVGIGNCHGADGDKFQRFGLTPKRATKVAAPLIAECYANFECRLRDTRMIRSYGLFIWEVVKAHVAVSPKRPQTIHYRGEGEFMVSGGTINRRRKFRPENL